MAKFIRVWSLIVVALTFAACDDAETDGGPQVVDEQPAYGQDLPVGSVENAKEDGVWGDATTCKDIPYVEPLTDPVIVISLDGLTLHLYDRAGDYDQVFPVGVGSINEGASLTPTSTQFTPGKYFTRTDEPAVDDGPTPEEGLWGWNQRCRVWSSAANEGPRIPYFAGLPFIRFAGHPTSAAYGMHGPIDQYPNANGGTLRQGYVSHGCVRMDAEGIKEVWGRIQGVQAELLVQKPLERRADGTPVVLDRWLLSECEDDSDCTFEGGVCRTNDYRGTGFCTQACEGLCPDRAGHPVSYCAAEGEDAGFCTFKSDAANTNYGQRLDGFVEATDVPRPDGSRTANVCLPGTNGWIGDRCLTDDECMSGTCLALGEGPEGICTESCTQFCPDSDVATDAATYCVNAPESVDATGGICLAQCYNSDHCPAGTTCKDRPRYNQTDLTKSVCIPAP